MAEMHKSKTILVSSLVAVVAGAAVMLGWILHIPALESIVPGFIAMKFNAALCFVLFGLALLTTQNTSLRFRKAIFLFLSVSVTVIGFVTLLEFLFPIKSGIDQLFITDPTPVSRLLPYPGRMAFNAAVNFVFLGIGLLCCATGKRWAKAAGQYFFHLVAVLSAIALVGYVYGVSFITVFLYETSMATHTAVLFILLAAGASMLNPSIGVTRLFTGKGVGDQMAKRLFTMMILTILVFGLIEARGAHNGLFSSLDIGISLLAVCFLLVSLLLIWNTAAWLNGIDRKRTQAEEEVRRMNAGLEKIVAERTAEFQASEEKYRSLIEQASDAIYVLDERWNFIDANASMCKIIGYSRDELMLMNVEDIIDPEELKNDPVARMIKNPKDAVIRERKFKRKNGWVVPVEINVKMFNDNRTMVIARDITYRKKMEDELREAELKFRTLAEKSVIGIYIIQDDHFIYVNPHFASIFGYAQEELINSIPPTHVLHESYRKFSAEQVRRRISGEIESVQYEAQGLKKDGGANWVEVYGSRVTLQNKTTIIGSMLDITSRKRAEEELKSSEQKYKLLFESSPMPMWMISKDDQSIIAVNEAAAEMYGYTQAELLKTNAKKLRIAQDRELQIQGYKTDHQRATSLPELVRHLKKDGAMMYVQIVAHDIIFEGRKVRLSLTIDMTEKVKAEESLKKSEAHLRTILNATDTAYALFDKNLKVLAYNQKAAAFLKERYRHTAEKDDYFSGYFPPDQFPHLAANAAKVLEGTSIGFEVEYPQDGKSHWYDVRLSPIINDGQEILGLLMAMYDISDRKNSEQSLKHAYESIQNHISSIRDMAWKQSHLIRSPLANLKGLTELLKEFPAEASVIEHFRKELDRMDAILIEMANDAAYHDSDE